MRNSLCRAAVLMILALARGRAADEELVVVVHSSVTAREISSAALREIFLGDKRSLQDGSKITPVLLKNGPTHEAFLKTYIAKSDGAFRAGWMRLVFTGKGSLPRTFDTEAGLLEYVAATPGTIGYVRSFTARANVRILAVK